MSAVNSWDIDDWLKSLGIDCCTDVVMGHGPAGYSLQVRIPAGDNADEYLCGLEQAWADHFGCEPVEFKTYEPRPIKKFEVDVSRVSLVGTPADAYRAFILAYAKPIMATVAKSMTEALADHFKNPPVPLHLVDAKGPRNKWGGAKGMRAR